MDQNILGLLTVIGGLVKYAGMCILTGFSLAAGGLTGWMLYKSLLRRRVTKGSDQVSKPADQEMQQRIYRKEEIAMRKFWKKQVEDLGGDPSVLLKSRTQLAKEMVMAMVAAHKEAITVRNAGYVIGRAACIVKNPCVEFWQGVKDGFDN